MKLAEVPIDPDCGTAHLGRCDGMTFRDRMLGVQVPASVTPTRTLRSYYDHEAVDDQLGSNRKDRKERFLDDTHGIGTTRRHTDGHYYRKDRKDGGKVKVSDKELESLGLGAP